MAAQQPMHPLHAHAPTAFALSISPHRDLPQKLFEPMWVCVSSPKHKTWHTALSVLKCLSTLLLFMGTGTPEELQPCV